MNWHIGIISWLRYLHGLVSNFSSFWWWGHHSDKSCTEFFGLSKLFHLACYVYGMVFIVLHCMVFGDQYCTVSKKLNILCTGGGAIAVAAVAQNGRNTSTDNISSLSGKTSILIFIPSLKHVQRFHQHASSSSNFDLLKSQICATDNLLPKSFLTQSVKCPLCPVCPNVLCSLCPFCLKALVIPGGR